MRRLPLPPVAGTGGYWFMAATAVVGVSSLGFHVVVSRLLGPGAYSAFGSLLALLVLMTVPAIGFYTLVTARTAQLVEAGRPLDATVLFGRALTVGGLCTVAMLATAPLIAHLLRLGSGWPVLWLALYCMPLAAMVVPWGWLCGHGRFRAIGTIIVVAAALRIALAVLLIRLGLGVSGAVAASVAADSVQALALYRTAGWLRPRDPEQRRAAVPVRINARAALGGVSAFVGLWLLTGVDTIAARLFLDPVAAGRYSAAATALHAALYPANAICLAALPAFASTEAGRSRRALARVLASTAVVTVPAMAVAAFAGPTLVPLVFGPTFAVPVAVTSLIATATTGLALLWVLVQYSIARSRREAALAWLGVPIAALGIGNWHSALWQVGVVMLVVVAAPLALAAWSLSTRPDRVPVPRPAAEVPAPGGSVDLTVVVPFYNPGPALRPNLLRLVDELRACGVTFEVIAVDDGSADGSAATIADLDPGTVRLLSLPRNQGKGAALRYGLSAGGGRYLGFIDADGDLDPALWRSFTQLIRLYRPDAIVGDKRHPLTAIDSAASWTRNLCSLGYRMLVSLLFPALPVRDTQVGFKVFRREVLADVLPRCVERRFVLDVELLALATRLGYRRILGAPVSLYRVDRTTVTARAVVRMFVDTLRLSWRLHVRDAYGLSAPRVPPVPQSRSVSWPVDAETHTALMSEVG